jgi:hypothetical protein
MATGRYTTNPKRIIPLESKHVLLSVHRDNNGKINCFSFEGLDPDTQSLYGFGTLDKKAKLILEIDNRIDIQRVELGTLENPKTINKQQFNMDGSFANLSFRFFIIDGYEVKASKEKVVPSGIFEGDRRTLIRVEPEDLGEIAWRVYPYDGTTEPVLKINNNKECNFVNLLVEPIGKLLIFQNALEQILWIYVEADEESEWVNHWNDLFHLKGIDIPARQRQKHEYSNWIEETMIILSNELKLLSQFSNSNQGE